jgi:hypothetical protein
VAGWAGGFDDNPAVMVSETRLESEFEFIPSVPQPTLLRIAIEKDALR